MRIVSIITIALLLVGCDRQYLWNSPYQLDDLNKNIYFSAFISPPKTLDPAQSYTVDSNLFLAQILEPPLQYDYFTVPYQLMPLAARQLPAVSFVDENLKPYTKPVKQHQYTIYDVYLRDDLYYSSHPAFVLSKSDDLKYYPYKAKQIIPNSIYDFAHLASKKAIASDFVYQIKRLASPKVNSPIYSLMAKYIDGFAELNEQLVLWTKQHPQSLQSDVFLDLRQFDLAGVKVIDDFHYQIRIKGDYPQFIYWLAMNFFAPVPWQLDAFYSQQGFGANNLSFTWQPVGTGPYQLKENNPNKVMRLTKNPKFHEERFPKILHGSDELLAQAGQKLPFIDEFVFSLDKESIPRWHKFLQGFYDKSAISAHSFASSVRIDSNGKLHLSDELSQKDLQLKLEVSPDIFYLGFNMLDPVVGGSSKRAKLLRQAISMVIDYDEFIQIFMSGRGVVAQGPIPPTIFGSSGKAAINWLVYHWQDNKLVRNSLQQAKMKMQQAGYQHGINPKTGLALQLNYDVPISSGPDDKARFAWMQEQFAKLGITLNIRATQYNRFQDKALQGRLQIFNWGWLADYPDPENFLFLLYGPNATVKSQGPNTSNYNNPIYNELFEQMRVLPNNKVRQQLINQMVDILREDSPWVWGVHSKQLSLAHGWVQNDLPNSFANNSLKYYKLDVARRYHNLKCWNTAHLFWLVNLLLAVFCLIFLIYWQIRVRQNKLATKTHKIIMD